MKHRMWPHCSNLANGLVLSLLLQSVTADHYATLGVSRSAAAGEIKASYRKLVQKWHPDRNPSDEAKNRIMTINEAYDVLSKPEKKAEYDAFGMVHENGAPNHRSRGGQQWFMHAPFEEMFDYFPGFSRRPAFSSNVVLDLDFRTYRLTHLPRSRSVPVLILGFSDLCIPCQRVRPLWSQIADDLTPMGVTVAAVNLERDGALRDELRVFHVPSVTMVIDGRVSYYPRNGFSHKDIIDAFRRLLLQSNPSNSKAIPSFLSTTLDTPLIQTVPSEAVFLNQFHPGWRRDSRPRMLLFKPLAVPSLRFALAAFRAADYLAAGFVNTESTEAAGLIRKHGLEMDEESLLIFHEDPHTPVSVHSSSRLSPADLDRAMLTFSQLTVPRIFSTARLLDLCATDGSEPSSPYAVASELRTQPNFGGSGNRRSGLPLPHRHVSFVLLLHSKQTNVDQVDGHADHWLRLLRQVTPEIRKRLQREEAGAAAAYKVQFQPVHVYADRQATWLRGISPHSEMTDEVTDLTHPENIGHIFLLWRVTSQETAVHLLPSDSEAHPANLIPLTDATPSEMLHSNAPPSDVYNRLCQALMPALIRAIAPLARQSPVQFVAAPPHNWHVTKGFAVEDYVTDELVMPLWFTIRRRLGQLISEACEWLYDWVAEPLSFVFSTTVIMVGLLLYTLTRTLVNATEDSPNNSANNRSKTSHGNAPTNDDRKSESPKRSNNFDSRSTSFRRIIPSTVLSLNPLTYDRLVFNAPVGHQLLIVCIRGDSVQDRRIANDFASKTAHISGPQIQCAQLSLTRHAGWLAELLQSARSGAPVRLRETHRGAATSTGDGTVLINPANCVGTVLAVNGWRRYFRIYHPLLPSVMHSLVDSSDSDFSDPSDVEPGSPSSPNRPTRILRRRRVFGRVLGFDSEDEADEEEMTTTPSRPSNCTAPDQLLECELLDGLPNWLDRLFEGSLPRYQLTDWPENLRGIRLDESD